MTPKAHDFIGAMTLEAVSNQSVPLPQNKNALAYFDYLDLVKRADLMLIAPATADFIAHIAQGLASDLLQTLVLARGCPMLIAPAMNENMWKNRITAQNVEKLKKSDVNFVGPGSGDLACGDEGIGRLADIDEILKAVQKITG
ncbi:hypothetical protein LCGC14_0968280 [marine sediment metagenome]|uniref:Flavoprotein domain-containing protein n=1 Tax=marine sediment metagenome TaxID=412755 RepID=A0A0F9RIW3_9ZZZZ